MRPVRVRNPLIGTHATACPGDDDGTLLVTVPSEFCFGSNAQPGRSGTLLAAKHVHDPPPKYHLVSCHVCQVLGIWEGRVSVHGREGGRCVGPASDTCMQRAASMQARARSTKRRAAANPLFASDREEKLMLISVIKHFPQFINTTFLTFD